MTRVASGQNRALCLSRLCFKLLKGSCEVQIHVEVVTRGKRGRERIATIERDANVAGTDGIGLTLDEVGRCQASCRISYA